MTSAFLVLRSLHMLFAILWVGGAIFRFMSLRRARNSAEGIGPVLGAGWQGPYMGLTAIGTFGFGLAAMLNGGDTAYQFEGLGDGFFLFHGALGMGTLALLVGFVGHMPAEKKFVHLHNAKLAGESVDEDQYERLVDRNMRLSHVSVILLGFALIGMTFFRAFV